MTKEKQIDETPAKGNEVGVQNQSTEAKSIPPHETIATITIAKDDNGTPYVVLNGNNLPTQSKEDTLKLLNEYLSSVITDVA